MINLLPSICHLSSRSGVSNLSTPFFTFRSYCYENKDPSWAAAAKKDSVRLPKSKESAQPSGNRAAGGARPRCKTRYLQRRQNSVPVEREYSRSNFAPKSSRRSTDSRKLFSRKHIDHARTTDARFHHDKAGMVARDFANNGGFLPKGM